MEESTGHRKIELQSPEDLAYLVTNVRRAAQERVNEAFPLAQGANDDDQLRSQIEGLVNEYIARTFTLAAPNLSINGLPVDPPAFLSPSSAPETAYEPFDTKARQRVEDLTREEEDLLKEIAQLKRAVPAAAAQRLADGFRATASADEAALARRVEAAAAAAPEAVLEAGVLERQGDVEAAYGGAVGGLERVKREMPAVVAKMERARVAGEYVMTER